MVDLEAPQGSQEPPKSSQKELGRAQKRLQNHFWIENVDFSTEQIKNDIDGPRTLPRPSSAARGEQTRPKRVPR